MITRNTEYDDAGNLRKRAEAKAAETAARMPEDEEALSLEESRRLIHELRVHRIELEIQNDELRRERSELAASRNRYFDLYDLAPTGYFTINAEGLILDSNLTAATHLGVARNALIGQPLTRFILPEDQDIYYRHRRQLFETGAPQVCEIRMERTDAAPFWARLEAIKALNAGGEAICRVMMSDITGHKQTEEELYQYRKDLDHAQEVGQIGSWRLDVLRNVLTWSDETYRIFGLPKGTDLTYETFLGIVHPDDRQSVETKWKAALRGEPYDIEHRILVAGEVRWVREKAYLEFDEAGKLLGGFGIAQNITERKQAEEALGKSENLYRSLFENMLNGFAYCRVLFEDGAPRDFICLAVNDAFEKLTGLGNVIGRKVTEVIPGIREADPQLFEIFGRVAMTGRPERFEMFIESMGMWFSISVYSPAREHFVAVFDMINELKENEQRRQKAHDELEERVQERTRALTLSNEQLSQEIKERQQAEARLMKSKEMLQTVFDGISDPLVLLDKDLRVKVLNKSAVAYFSLAEPREVIGEFCHIAFKGESYPCAGCKIPQAFSNAVETDFERRGFMDPLRQEKVFVYPLHQKNGEAPEIIYRISDITEKKLFEKRFIQNEKMASLGVLVSSVAHEINNPNSFISFNIPILKEYIEQMIGIMDNHAKTNPELELFQMSYPEFRKDIFRLVSNIEHGSERIGSFVSNLKEFSRIQYKGKGKQIDLTMVAEKAVSICRVKVKKTVKSFTVDIPENFPRIHTDPIALEQILINLLINAAQAADKEDSWIRLSAAIGRTWLDYAVIEVRDNGCGIDKKNMDHIFDPFFSTKTPSEGTGLGLYVCHDLVTGLGGRIEVESAAGEFSAFRVIIPDMERRKETRL